MQEGTAHGNLFVFAAPSGAGKSSLVAEIIQSMEHIALSVSHTTRPMRSSDQCGREYHFVTQAEFDQLISDEVFLEHAKVYDHSYGTSQVWVQEQLSVGIDVILEIDWQGARSIKQLYPQAILIFILPPSVSTLQSRLEGRGQDSAEVVSKRMAVAHNEMSHYKEFDYLIVNDDFAEAKSNLIAIIRAERLAMVRQSTRYAKLLAHLVEKR